MGKRYTADEQAQALKACRRNWGSAAPRRLRIKVDTLYGFQGRRRSVPPPWSAPWV